MVKVSFAGAYGIRSQGDDAALLSIVLSLRDRLGPFDGVVIARHATENSYEPYGLRSIQNLEYDRKSDSVGKWFRGFNRDDDRSQLRALQEEIGSSDLLVLGAGNFLVDFTIDLLRGPIPYLVILTLMAKMTGTPVFWYGMSVGPFQTDYGRNLSRLAAGLVDAITVRDYQSRLELQQLGCDGPIVQLPDAVLGLHPPPPEVVDDIASWREAPLGSGPVVAVSVRDMVPGSVLDTQRYVECMAAVCDGLVERYEATLLFVPQCTYTHGEPSEDDRVVARWVVERMKYAGGAVIVNEDLTVMQCLGLYGQADLALCTRLHANVYAAIQGVPHIAISYNPKVDGFMHWLGCNDLVMSLQEISPQKVLEKAEGVLAEREKRSRAILDLVAMGRAEVGRYADIVCDLMVSTRRVA